MFLPFSSNSILLVAGWWLSLSYRRILPPWESQTSAGNVRNFLSLYDLEKPQNILHPEDNFYGRRNSALKPTKPRGMEFLFRLYTKNNKSEVLCHKICVATTLRREKYTACKIAQSR
jgi:hypothetical protein